MLNQGQLWLNGKLTPIYYRTFVIPRSQTFVKNSITDAFINISYLYWNVYYIYARTKGREYCSHASRRIMNENTLDAREHKMEIRDEWLDE